MKPVRTVEVQVIELDAVEDAARRERVQGAFLGFNVGVTVMLFGVGLVRGELLVLLPALALVFGERLQLVARGDDGFDIERVEDHPRVLAWRQKLHRDVTALREPSEQRERLLRSPQIDNKETFLVEWRGERWYVQFYDNLVYLCRRAHIRPKEW